MTNVSHFLPSLDEQCRHQALRVGQIKDRIRRHRTMDINPASDIEELRDAEAAHSKVHRKIWQARIAMQRAVEDRRVGG